MKKQVFLNKSFILCLVMLISQNIVVAQDDYCIIRPQAEVVNPIFNDLIDTAINEMDECGHKNKSSYYFYLFEMEGEGNYHCWLEAHSFSKEMFRILPKKWDEDEGSGLFWPEGYFYHKGTLCLVRTSYPGVNFIFSNKNDTITYPLQVFEERETEKDGENCNYYMLIYPSIRGNKIDYPFKIEIECQ